ncbi:MAG: alpha/beta fold hydrolase [Actinobacteria bacterium]|nr:alpha/beta fold hydrolase [Actinomycetota bacterium]
MRRGALVVVVVLGVVAAGAGGCGQLRRQASDGTASDGGGTASGGGPAAGTSEQTVTTADGRRRTFRTYVPASAAGRTGLPVVVLLHGGGGNGETIEQQSRMSAVADRAGFVAVYPNGTGGISERVLTWNAGSCCGYARDHDVDDVAFISAMLDALAARLHTDPARVYVTGFSNGGMMTHRLGCELTDRITAIAAVSGALNVDHCRPTRPLPVLIVHGTADKNVPYGGGPPADPPFPGAGSWTNRSVPEAVSFWTGQDHCPATPSRSRQGSVLRDTYSPCTPGVDVTVYTIEGGGHTWPGGRKGRDRADDPAPTLDASAVIWDFFARHGAR